MNIICYQVWVKLWFISCAKPILAIWFPYKHCNLWLLCLPGKVAFKTMTRHLKSATTSIGAIWSHLRLFRSSQILKVCWDLIWPFILEDHQIYKPLEQIILIDRASNYNQIFFNLNNWHISCRLRMVVFRIALLFTCILACKQGQGGFRNGEGGLTTRMLWYII